MYYRELYHNTVYCLIRDYSHNSLDVILGFLIRWHSETFPLCAEKSDQLSILLMLYQGITVIIQGTDQSKDLHNLGRDKVKVCKQKD